MQNEKISSWYDITADATFYVHIRNLAAYNFNRGKNTIKAHLDIDSQQTIDAQIGSGNNPIIATASETNKLTPPIEIYLNDPRYNDPVCRAAAINSIAYNFFDREIFQLTTDLSDILQIYLHKSDEHLFELILIYSSRIESLMRSKGIVIHFDCEPNHINIINSGKLIHLNLINIINYIDREVWAKILINQQIISINFANYTGLIPEFNGKTLTELSSPKAFSSIEFLLFLKSIGYVPIIHGIDTTSKCTGIATYLINSAFFTPEQIKEIRSDRTLLEVKAPIIQKNLYDF